MTSNTDVDRTVGAKLMANLRAEGAHPATYRAGDLVMDPAVDRPRVGIVCDGAITVWRLSPKGKQLATASLRQGDWFENLFPSETYERTFIEADASAHVAWLEGAAFQRLLRKHPSFSVELVRSQIRRLAAVETRASHTALASVADSVALALLQMAEREGTTDLEVTHEELAQRLGTVRESVSLAISTLRRAGALAPAQGRKRLISILSLSKLQQHLGYYPSGT